MSDIPDRVPTSDADYADVAAYITERREPWEQYLAAGRTALAYHLAATGYTPVTADVRPGQTDADALGRWGVAVSARLKATDAIVSKMGRFGEPLRVMLDIWGYRVVVPTPDDLDPVATACADLWQTPTPEQLLLRHGAMQFDWWRDYRQRNHAGLSPATTDRYDEAIHLNRRAPFGIVEIQVMTLALHDRVHSTPNSDDSHARYVVRREALYRDQTP